LKTANSGYLTRRLVDVAQDVVVTEAIAVPTRVLLTTPVIDGGDIIETLQIVCWVGLLPRMWCKPGTDEVAWRRHDGG
jgi:DNA-directed RNA polymerase subunit beta'